MPIYSTEYYNWSSGSRDRRKYFIKGRFDELLEDFYNRCISLGWKPFGKNVKQIKLKELDRKMRDAIISGHYKSYLLGFIDRKKPGHKLTMGEHYNNIGCRYRSDYYCPRKAEGIFLKYALLPSKQTDTFA